MEAGFYKYQDEILIRAGKFVYAPTYTLLVENKDTYTFPIDGWHWFDDKTAALQFFGLSKDVLFIE